MYPHLAPRSSGHYRHTTTGDIMHVDNGVVSITPPPSKVPTVEPASEDDDTLPVYESTNVSTASSPCVITFEDMSDDTGLNKLDVDDPRFGILYTIVEWSMGVSRPYIHQVEVENSVIKITFIKDDTLDGEVLRSLMTELYREAGVEGEFVYQWASNG